MAARFLTILALAYFIVQSAALPADAAAGKKAAPEPEVYAAVELEGAESLSEKELRRVLPVRAGAEVKTDPEDRAKEENLARESLLSFYRSRGWLEVEASTRARRSPEGPVFVIAVREGPLFRFGKTRITGLERIRESVMLRELTWDEGDAYDRSQLFRTQANLYALGLAEEVGISASTGPARTADITIRVREAPQKWIKGGIGYGSEERERLTLSLAHNNFLKRGYKLDLTGTASAIWYDYKASFTNRHFFGTRIQQESVAGFRHEVRPGYTFETALGQVSLVRKFGGTGSSLSSPLRLSPYYQYNRTKVFDISTQLSSSTPVLLYESKVGFSLNWDSSDDYFFPSRGARVTLVLERAGGFLGASANFNKAYLNGTYYQPLPLGLTGVLTARAGGEAGFRDSFNVPITERLFTGGANSIRGYREREVGPLDSLGEAIGGETLAGANLELRFPIYKKLSGAAFYDGGQVGHDAKDVFPARWKFGAGGGLRLKTPVGPIRVDAGFKIKPPPGSDRWRLHVSIGEAF